MSASRDSVTFDARRTRKLLVVNDDHGGGRTTVGRIGGILAARKDRGDRGRNGSRGEVKVSTGLGDGDVWDISQREPEG